MTVTRVPPVSTLSAKIRPPCISTNCLAMLKPRPSPRLQNPKSPEEWRLGSNWVKNGWNKCWSARGSRPTPRSSTTISASSAPLNSCLQLDLTRIGREFDRVGEQIDQDRGDLIRVDVEIPEILGLLDLQEEPTYMEERPDLVDHPLDQV